MDAALLSFCAILFLILFCASLLDIALRSLNYTKINSLRRHGNKTAQKLFTLLSSPEQAISVLLFLRYISTAVFYMTSAIFLMRLPLSADSRILLAVAVLLVMLILVEYVPRMLAVQNPERIAFTLANPFALLLKANKLFPFPRACERLASRVLRIYGFNGEKIFSQYSVNEIKMFLSTGKSKGDSDLKRQTIDSKFLDFSGRRVREVMVPRPFVKALDINTPLTLLITSIQENGYSRIPIFRSNLDNIFGVLHVKDIIGVSEPFSLESILRKPFFIPESATVQDAFQNMRRSHSHMAIVVDEYGGVDGIVTLEDLIEQLIGEIEDEHDETVELAQKVNEGFWVLEGNLPIKELNQNLNVELPEDASYTTVAGFLISILDKIPNERDQIRYGDLVFTIDKVTGHKIARVSLRLPHPPKESPVL